MSILMLTNPRICNLEGNCGHRVVDECATRTTEGVLRAKFMRTCMYLPVAKKVEEKKVRVGQQKQKTRK